MISRNALTSGLRRRYEKFPGFGFEKERVGLGRCPMFGDFDLDLCVTLSSGNGGTGPPDFEK